MCFVPLFRRTEKRLSFKSCRRHHRMAHSRGGFRLELEDGRPGFRRDDGTVLEERASP
jgi:hypothetical protein